MEKTLKEALKLDIMDLDTACLEQASLYEEVGEEWAVAVAERDRLKERLSLKRAELDAKIRANPKDYGNSDKVTENWVSSKISMNPEVIVLNEELIEAQYNVNALAVGKESVEHRGNSLRFLTELYKGNYFAAVSRRFSPLGEASSTSQLSQGEKMDDHPRIQEIKRRRIEKGGQHT
jgi:hypothetical protein